jgi:hypothetical protein
MKKGVVMIDQKYVNVSCFDSPYTWKKKVIMITQKHEKKIGCHDNPCACKYGLLWQPTCMKKKMVVLATQNVYKMGYKEPCPRGLL